MSVNHGTALAPSDPVPGFGVDTATSPAAEFARPVLVQGNHTAASVTDLVCGIVERPAPRWWWYAIGVSSLVTLGGLFAACYLSATGIGVWGLARRIIRA